MFESYGTGSFREALLSAAQGKGFASRNAGVRVSGIVEDDREMKRVYNPSHPGCGCRWIRQSAQCGFIERDS